MRMRSVCLPVTAATRIELEFKHLPDSCLANEAVPVTDNFAELRHAQSEISRGWQACAYSPKSRAYRASHPENRARLSSAGSRASIKRQGAVLLLGTQGVAMMMMSTVTTVRAHYVSSKKNDQAARRCAMIVRACLVGVSAQGVDMCNTGVRVSLHVLILALVFTSHVARMLHTDWHAQK